MRIPIYPSNIADSCMDPVKASYMPLIGDRIAQLVIPGDQYYDEVNFIISDDPTLFANTERGEGGFGSTGK